MRFRPSQSVATAVCFAIDDGVPAQNVDYAKLRERSLKDEQVLEWQDRTPRALTLHAISSYSWTQWA